MDGPATPSARTTASDALRTSGVDPRVLRTRTALRDALGGLVEAGLPVTMSAIAQRAALSRQVLHNHYASVGQLASEVLVGRMLAGTRRPVPADSDAAVDALAAAVRAEGLTPFLRFIQDDRAAFTALRRLGHEQSAEILARVFVGMLGELTDGRARAADARAASLFSAGGMVALVEAWLRDEGAEPAEALAARLERSARAVFAAAS